MGVHASPEVYEKVKKLLGIPKDEPIFVFRAQDLYAPGTIAYYKQTVHDNQPIGRENLAEWEAEVGSDYNDFLNWQRDNRERVKVPD